MRSRRREALERELESLRKEQENQKRQGKRSSVRKTRNRLLEQPNNENQVWQAGSTNPTTVPMMEDLPENRLAHTERVRAPIRRHQQPELVAAPPRQYEDYYDPSNNKRNMPYFSQFSNYPLSNQYHHSQRGRYFGIEQAGNQERQERNPIQTPSTFIPRTYSNTRKSPKRTRRASSVAKTRRQSLKRNFSQEKQRAQPRRKRPSSARLPAQQQQKRAQKLEHIQSRKQRKQSKPALNSSRTSVVSNLDDSQISRIESIADDFIRSTDHRIMSESDIGSPIDDEYQPKRRDSLTLSELQDSHYQQKQHKHKQPRRPVSAQASLNQPYQPPTYEPLARSRPQKQQQKQQHVHKNAFEGPSRRPPSAYTSQPWGRSSSVPYQGSPTKDKNMDQAPTPFTSKITHLNEQEHLLVSDLNQLDHQMTTRHSRSVKGASTFVKSIPTDHRYEIKGEMSKHRQRMLNHLNSLSSKNVQRLSSSQAPTSKSKSKMVSSDMQPRLRQTMTSLKNSNAPRLSDRLEKLAQPKKTVDVDAYYAAQQSQIDAAVAEKKRSRSVPRSRPWSQTKLFGSSIYYEDKRSASTRKTRSKPKKSSTSPPKVKVHLKHLLIRDAELKRVKRDIAAETSARDDAIASSIHRIKEEGSLMTDLATPRSTVRQRVNDYEGNSQYEGEMGSPAHEEDHEEAYDIQNDSEFDSPEKDESHYHQQPSQPPQQLSQLEQFLKRDLQSLSATMHQMERQYISNQDEESPFQQPYASEPRQPSSSHYQVQPVAPKKENTLLDRRPTQTQKDDSKHVRMQEDLPRENPLVSKSLSSNNNPLLATGPRPSLFEQSIQSRRPQNDDPADGPSDPNVGIPSVQDLIRRRPKQSRSGNGGIVSRLKSLREKMNH